MTDTRVAVRSREPPEEKVMPLTPETLDDAARRIKLVLFDVDGVLTDGRLHYGPSGEVMKTLHARDGHGMVLLRSAGLVTGVLSGRDSEIVRTRMRELGARHVIQGSRDKSASLDRLLQSTGFTEEEIAFMGDDVNDVRVMERVGLSAAPCDAADEALAVADFVARKSGGLGAARELCDLILRACGHAHP